MSHPRFSRDVFAKLLVFAARQHYDETGPATALFLGPFGDEPHVAIMVDGRPLVAEWDGETFRENWRIKRCPECGEKPGEGALEEEDDRGKPYLYGCSLCIAHRMAESDETRVEWAVEQMEVGR
jgi:hypothetical protein